MIGALVGQAPDALQRPVGVRGAPHCMASVAAIA
jgi:hypothetical protein